MTSTVEVHGLRELRTALTKTIPLSMRGKVLQKAMSKGASAIAREARRNVPVREGTLKRAIFAGRDKRSSNGVYEQRIIGVRAGKRFRRSKRDAFYWRFIEFGTKYIRSTPFLRPAFESRKQMALRSTVDGLREGVRAAAALARWRSGT